MKLLTNLLFEPRGRHNPALAYSIKDTVMSADGSRVYFALQDVPPGISLDNTDYWILQIDLSNVQVGGLSPLIGSTVELTPSQVAQAVSEGRNVVVSHTDPNYGQMIFNYFVIAASMNMIASSSVFKYSGQMVVCQLVGRLDVNTWEAYLIPLA